MHHTHMHASAHLGAYTLRPPTSKKSLVGIAHLSPGCALAVPMWTLFPFPLSRRMELTLTTSLLLLSLLQTFNIVPRHTHWGPRNSMAH